MARYSWKGPDRVTASVYARPEPKPWRPTEPIRHECGDGRGGGEGNGRPEVIEQLFEREQAPVSHRRSLRSPRGAGRSRVTAST